MFEDIMFMNVIHTVIYIYNYIYIRDYIMLVKQ